MFVSSVCKCVLDFHGGKSPKKEPKEEKVDNVCEPRHACRIQPGMQLHRVTGEDKNGH